MKKKIVFDIINTEKKSVKLNDEKKISIWNRNI